METGPMRYREPHSVDHPSAEDLLQIVAVGPPVSGAAMSIVAEIVGMKVKVHPVLRRFCLSHHAPVMVENVVIPHITAPGVVLIPYMIDTKPVEYPSAPL